MITTRPQTAFARFDGSLWEEETHREVKRFEGL